MSACFSLYVSVCLRVSVCACSVYVWRVKYMMLGLRWACTAVGGPGLQVLELWQRWHWIRVCEMLVLTFLSTLAVQWPRLRAKLAAIILMSGTPESRSWYNQPWATFPCTTFSCCYIFFISSGLCLQRLEAELWYPGQRLSLGHSSDWILATRPVVSNKALALQLCMKRIPTEMQSSETSTY